MTEGKLSSFTFSENKGHHSLVAIFPAWERKYSLGKDVAGTVRYILVTLVEFAISSHVHFLELQWVEFTILVGICFIRSNSSIALFLFSSVVVRQISLACEK